MRVERFELDPASENLYDEIRELIHTQYIKNTGFLSFRLFSHSSVTYQLKLKEPLKQPLHLRNGLTMDFNFIDIPMQRIHLEVSDDTNTVFLEVRAQN